MTRSFVRDGEIWPRILTQVWGSHISIKGIHGQIHTFLDHEAACGAKKLFLRRGQLQGAGCHKMFLFGRKQEQIKDKAEVVNPGLPMCLLILRL